MTESVMTESPMLDPAASDSGFAHRDPTWLRLWLAILLVAAAVSTVQISFWPRRPVASLPPSLPQHGQSLPSLPGHTEALTAVSTIRGQRLPGGLELRIAAVVSAQRNEIFQVAGLTAPLPALHLFDRRLLQRAAGEVAQGRLGGRPALQTCLIGSSQAVTAEALQHLAVRKQPPSGGRWPRLLGLQPQPDSRCLLVTMVAPQSSPELPLLTRFEAVLDSLRSSS
jgi:hypothetical protein